MCSRYAAFVKALDECSRDNLDIIKEKAMRAMADLLASRPEQEAPLLTSLVNKLGDPSRKLASKVPPPPSFPPSPSAGLICCFSSPLFNLSGILLAIVFTLLAIIFTEINLHDQPCKAWCFMDIVALSGPRFCGRVQWPSNFLPACSLSHDQESEGIPEQLCSCGRWRHDVCKRRL